MSLQVSVAGKTKSYGAKITTTGVTTVFTAQPKTPSVAIGVNLCNIDGTSAVDATVSWYDLSATTTYFIASTKSVAADNREHITFEVALEPGDEIRVTAGAANDLDVIVTVVETPGNV